jgi:hypothetical protein
MARATKLTFTKVAGKRLADLEQVGTSFTENVLKARFSFFASKEKNHVPYLSNLFVSSGVIVCKPACASMPVSPRLIRERSAHLPRRQ